MTAPRLEAYCARHGGPFVQCDHCANTVFMRRWAEALSNEELAEGLVKMWDNPRYYSQPEHQAILAESAFRLREI